MDSLFYGSSEKAFFSFDDIDSARTVIKPLYPMPYYNLLHSKQLTYEPKVNGEIRLIIADIATSGGDRNDNTALALLRLIPTSSNQYIRINSYMESLNGGHSYDQAIRIRQLYYDLECDYVVIDTLGVGNGVFDNLVQEQIDSTRNATYPAWGCINDDKLHDEKCKDVNAERIVYSIKATAQFNSDCAVFLRDGLRRNKVRLLQNEIDGSEYLSKIKGFTELPIEDQVLLQAPYYQTTALLNEMVNLDYEFLNGKIRVKEASNMRKDRYTAVSYGNWIANELERELRTTVSEYEYRTFVN
jgi:hypothetical protein